MKRTTKSAICTFMLAFALVSVSQVNADEFIIPFDEGVACSDFALTLKITTSDHYVVKQWTDESGALVRMLTAGKGVDLEFVNEETAATFKIKGNGSVSHTTYNPDGSSTVSTEGHNVIIFYPTDLPAGVGPSTKQYVGRVLYTVDEYGTFMLQEVKGKTTDICAALSE